MSLLSSASCPQHRRSMESRTTTQDQLYHSRFSSRCSSYRHGPRNGQGQVLCKTVTPFRPFFIKGTSTIWKIVPNSQPIYTGRRRNSSLEVEDDEGDGPQMTTLMSFRPAKTSRKPITVASKARR
ncbi:hypothetical protein BV22DRAFT_507787 [Leucogyrophana mollusca]|uniref:Uncharacterized protein n=1 Tax=Leucogyrophana mollusca TaxID=85980 RepID=A0ACB8BFA0_9AGAM|nr:hypothetical protein BV22DRAFT_507787 [Leucogyrophana mollusca]